MIPNSNTRIVYMSMTTNGATATLRPSSMPIFPKTVFTTMVSRWRMSGFVRTRRKEAAFIPTH